MEYLEIYADYLTKKKTDKDRIIRRRIPIPKGLSKESLTLLIGDSVNKTDIVKVNELGLAYDPELKLPGPYTTIAFPTLSPVATKPSEVDFDLVMRLHQGDIYVASPWNDELTWYNNSWDPISEFTDLKSMVSVPKERILHRSNKTGVNDVDLYWTTKKFSKDPSKMILELEDMIDQTELVTFPGAWQNGGNLKGNIGLVFKHENYRISTSGKYVSPKALEVLEKMSCHALEHGPTHLKNDNGENIGNIRRYKYR